MKPSELSVEGILESNKKTNTKDLRLTFKCDKFELDIGTKVHRLDGKKILSSKYEEMYQSVSGVRCVGKKVGYANGTLQYFPAVQDEKGKWVADTTQDAVAEVDKVILDVSSGLIAKKDTNRGIWFSKLVPNDVIQNWLIEETFNIYSEDNSDGLLKVYDYLMETKQVAVFKFNPFGTTYNGFLFPQRVNGGHFRLLLSTARVRIDKPEVAPTMVIANAQVRAKERERLDQIGVMSMVEEV